MGLFGRKYSIAETGLPDGFTDCHCHILPGVDDGVRTMDESLAILKCYEDLGIREVWLTPHVMEDVPNTTSGLQSRYEELSEKYQGKIRLHLAAEYMMDSLFEQRLMAGDLLTLGNGGGHVLVETSYFNPPTRMTEVLKDIKSAGLFPVLAHPERYMYMDMDDYAALSDSGVRLQLNLPSLAGNYGPDVQKKAFMLLKKGYYDIAGTDLHRRQQLDTLFTRRCLPRKIFKAGLSERLITL